VPSPRAADRRATEAFDTRPDDAPLGTSEDLARPDLSLHSPVLRTIRLDAIDRGLEAMGQRAYGLCARCGRLIGFERLHASPDTHVCEERAKAVLRAR